MKVKRIVATIRGQKVDAHFVVVGLAPKDCCDCLRRTLQSTGRIVETAWYHRSKRRGKWEDLCRADLFVKYA